MAFELLALRRAFHIEESPGAGGLHALVRIIAAGQVDWTQLPPGSPDALVRLIGACLKVDPAKRPEAEQLVAWPGL